MWACTCWRNSVIRRCAAFDNDCVSEKEVAPCTNVAANTTRTSGCSLSMRCLLMTVSIRNRLEYGSTKAATRLITMSPKPSASSPRRGRISAQTSGKTARSLWTLGGFGGSLVGEFNLLFDSFQRRSASLLLYCDTPVSAVVCSGRVPPVSAGPFADHGPVAGPASDVVHSARVFGLHNVAGDGPAPTADRDGGP